MPSRGWVAALPPPPTRCRLFAGCRGRLRGAGFELAELRELSRDNRVRLRLPLDRARLLLDLLPKTRVLGAQLLNQRAVRRGISRGTRWSVMSALRGCQEHRFERSNRDHPTRRIDSRTGREKRVFTASNSGDADASASCRSLQREGVMRLLRALAECIWSRGRIVPAMWHPDQADSVRGPLVSLLPALPAASIATRWEPWVSVFDARDVS